MLNMFLDNTNRLDSVSGRGNLKHNENHEYTIINEIAYDIEKHAGLSKEKDIPGYFHATLEKGKKESFNIAHIIKTQLKEQRKYLVVIAPIILIGLVLAGYGYLHENRSHHVDDQNKIAAKTHTDIENGSNAQPETVNNEMKIADASTHKVPDQTTRAVENTNNEMTREQNDSAPSQTY